MYKNICRTGGRSGNPGRRSQRSLNTTKKKTDIKKKQTLEAIQGNEFTVAVMRLQHLQYIA
jgi:hypothetical protein